MSAVRIRYRPLPKNRKRFWGGSSILVRAPACHAGGCEFKPRLSRDKALLFEKCFSFKVTPASVLFDHLRFSAYVGMIREWGRGQLTHYSSNRLNLEAYCGVYIDDKSLVHLKKGILAIRFKFARPGITKTGIGKHCKTP